MNSPGFPVCKPGANYQRSQLERELTWGKKIVYERNRLLFRPLFIRFLAVLLQINHLAE